MMRTAEQPRFVAKWVVGNGGFKGQVLLCHPTEAICSFVRPRQGVKLIEVADLYVHPLRRGSGWARELMSAALEYVDIKCLDVALRVAPHGSRSATPTPDALKRFYASFGFKPVRVPAGWQPEYDIPRDGVMLRKARAG
jgi:GNAT superfamily N-acetyltransferase